MIMSGCLLWILISCVQAAEQAAAVELKTQFGEQIQVLPVHERPLVLVYSDRAGAAQAGAWLDVIRPGPCRFLEVANLDAAPAIARPFVRRAFRDASPVLMDWRGALAGQLGFDEDAANVYLIDATNATILQVSGLATEEAMFELRESMKVYCDVDD